MAPEVILGHPLEVEQHHAELDGSPVVFRRACGAGPEPLYLHGVPGGAADWDPFLRRTGGVAVDLPGFGGSGKGGHLDYSLAGYLDFLERFLAAFQLQPEALVGHGWGAALAPLLAVRRPVERLVLIDPLPLLRGASFPPLVRRLRRPLLGELMMGVTTRPLLTRVLQRGTASGSGWSRADLDRVWQAFDQGTQRAILRLHRSVDEPGLVQAGQDVRELPARTLVVWGERDPWLDPALAEPYGLHLGDAQVWRVPAAGHWPWLDQPEVVDRVAAFLAV